MNPSNLIFELKKRLPEDAWGWVVNALRQDLLVWGSLDQTTLGQQALERGSTQPKDWSPASLALLSLEYPISAEELATVPVQPMASSIRPQAMHAFENWQTNLLAAPLDLPQVGLLALSFRERRRVTGSWIGFSTELKADLPGLDTIIACLYGMIPDPFDLLQALFLPESSPARPELGLHALLSNPQPEKAQSDLLSALLEEMSLSQRQNMLNMLASARPELAAHLAQTLFVPLIQAKITNLTVSQEAISPALRLDRLASLLQGAQAYHLACQPDLSLPILTEALHVGRQLQAELAAGLGHAASQTGDYKTALDAWKQACQLAPDEPSNAAWLALALLDENRPDDAQAYLVAKQADDPTPSGVLYCHHPAMLLASAMVSTQQGQISDARQAARQALEFVDGAQISAGPANLYPTLSKVLFDLDLPEEAMRAIHLALTDKPDQPELLELLAKTRLALGQSSQALEAACVALAREPGSPAKRALVIESLEACGDWSAALDEHEKLVASLPSPTPACLRAMAACAIRAGYSHRAIDAVKQTLKLDPNDGLAYSLLGEATLATGDSASALEHLNQATQLAPLYPAPWIFMSRIYHNLGQDEKAIEVLRTASQASPSAPEIHLALGEAYLAQGAPTQALTSLRRAAALVAARDQMAKTQITASSQLEIAASPQLWLPKSSRQEDSAPGLSNRVALQLGQTLHHLGHLDEARRVLENAYQNARDAQSDQALAYAYAKTLLDQNELQQAVDVLEIVVQSQPTDHSPYLDYARALLQLNNHPQANAQRAIPLLNRVLQFKPRHAEAQALLAEAYATAGELPNSLEAYRLALDTDLARETTWHGRLSLGLGSVALALKQYETAIAALHEAAQANPLNSEAQCGLSEAYLATGLVDEAYQAACNARQLNPSDVNTLVWFADQSIRLSEQPGAAQLQAQSEAVNALNLATQLAPSRTDLLIRLGQIQLETGDEQAALNTFSQLALASEVSCADLYQAAQNLRRLDDSQRAVMLLTQAISVTENQSLQKCADISIPLKDLLVELAIAQQQSGDRLAALAALDRAILLDPQDPIVSLMKADLLGELGQPVPALECIQTALTHSPADATLHLRAALLLRSLGNIPAALAHAEQAALFENVTASPDLLVANSLSNHTLVTELALAMLQFEKAREILHERWPASLQDDPQRLFEYACLRAEVALDAANEVCDSATTGDCSSAAILAKAIEALEIAAKIDENHPRCLANKARLNYRKGNSPTANKTFKTALLALDALSQAGDMPPEGLIITRRALAETAIELDDWIQALTLSRQVADVAPQEPLSHLQIARILVLRAERQHLCQVLGVIQHAPGASALDNEADLALETTVQTIERLMDSWQTGKASQETHQVLAVYNLQSIYRWKARGKAAFMPGQKSASELQTAIAGAPSTPDEVAALVTVLGQTGDGMAAAEAAQAFPQDPMVLRQLSLVMAESNPRQALGAARTAVNLISGGGYRRSNELPLFYTLLARLAYQAGERDSDQSTASQAIHTALAAWPDEPRWHVLAAEIALGQPDSETPADPATAIAHLEQATRLEPFNPDHELALGRIYLETGNTQKAIQALEQASRISPEQPDTWLMLAQAQLAAGELVQAALSADRAIDRSASPTKALLVRGEIDLQTNNPQEAQRRAVTVIQGQPGEPEAYYLLARALGALGKPSEALVVIERGIPLADQPLPLLLERARLLRQAKGLEPALETLRGLAEHYPEEPAVLALLAETLVEAGRSEAAIQSARMALQADRGKLDLEQHTYLHYLVGRQLRRAGQLDQAIYHLNEAVQQAPDHLESYLELGRAHQDRRQLEQALHVFQQAIEVAPNDYRAYFQAGLALKESKDYVSAEVMVRHAAELAPNDVSIHRLLGALVALNLVHNRHQSPTPA
jgi:tetratricopeptide (TPR) repeat protein